MKNAITIILAEHQELFRKSLHALLSHSADYQIIAEVSNGRDMIETLKQKFCKLVIMDVSLQDMSSRAALEIIRARFPETKVIVMGWQTGMEVMSDFMAKGANCFLAKDCGVDTLHEAIRTVCSEGYYFDKCLSKAMLDALMREKSTRTNTSVTFNARETEILQKICDGLTNKEIAAELHLSPSTIDFYRTRIYSKVKCNNVAQLLKFSLKQGLIVLT